MWIKLDDQLFNSDLIGSVKPIDDEHCSVFLAGASPIDGGFLLNWSLEEVEEVLSSTEEGSLLKMAEDLQKEIDDSEKKKEK